MGNRTYIMISAGNNTSIDEAIITNFRKAASGVLTYIWDYKQVTQLIK